MLPLRYSWTWLSAGLLLLVIGLVAALSPIPPGVAMTINDKLIHTAGFLVFMLWFGGVFKTRLAPAIVVALSCYGLLIEVLQSLTPTRQAEALDVVADVAGVLLGWALSAAGFSRWCVKLESWLVPKSLSAPAPAGESPTAAWRPLADRMRPATLAEVTGQGHLLGPGQPLTRLLSGNLHSAVLWGPPGSGKTTLARLLAATARAHFVALSAVLAGVKEVREAVTFAQANAGQPTVLFLDEVHRFNKAQQDAFLPFVEDGTLIFIGATTENPAFALNNALLSRARVYVLKPLADQDLAAILSAALRDPERGLGARQIIAAEPELLNLARGADGDARRALNLLEVAAGLVGDDLTLTPAIVATVLTGSYRRFDRQGDVFYEQISALHKSVRGSDPDAALYWLARMLDGGCDPAYIARRVVRMASEDIGNADPRALTLALEAWQAWERLGTPEGELALAQAVVFLACAAKSNATYTAWQAAQADAQAHGSLAVPPPLRPASTGLARSLGHGSGYRYAHDEPDAFAAGASYFPDELGQPTYYEPVSRGLEQRIAEKLADFRARNRAARQAKPPV